MAAQFGVEAGMVGAAALAFDGLRERAASGMSSGRLIVCPTPIGNLEDVTLRVLAALREADVVACEDTRRTRVLLDRYGVSAHLVSYHEHNEQERSAELVARMREGAVVALVSDAGMPLVSDPGFVLVRACVAAGPRGRGAAGPVGGAWRRWWRARCPPSAGGSRASCRASAAELIEAFSSPETLVAFESPRRVAASLAVLAETDPERPVAVCRELTKIHEEVVRGTAAELADALPRRAAQGRGRAGGRAPPPARAGDLGPGAATRAAAPDRRRRQAAPGGARSSPSSPATAPTRCTAG